MHSKFWIEQQKQMIKRIFAVFAQSSNRRRSPYEGMIVFSPEEIMKYDDETMSAMW